MFVVAPNVKLKKKTLQISRQIETILVLRIKVCVGGGCQSFDLFAFNIQICPIMSYIYIVISIVFQSTHTDQTECREKWTFFLSRFFPLMIFSMINNLKTSNIASKI